MHQQTVEKGRKEKKWGCVSFENGGHCSLLYTYQYELINYINDPPRVHLSLFWDYPSPGDPLLIISYLEEYHLSCLSLEIFL
jgi:hypothetical protein